ncbi:hypothetical protein GMORB2_2550 [Geosmithia morbida]|uniref:DNA replication factor Cdt1 C-terminal domain-containing protein n=1 Tax=Geosmithia morbida TaxID=1094350 RepID=A0A9P4YU44_9HYPO|nr:uncharacterized protein GMORB2_2550 [Geosmithia morbida]KAF4121064.1 hypothetical protein GMORB2_2550 [Geosmithia morbida]
MARPTKRAQPTTTVNPTQAIGRFGRVSKGNRITPNQGKKAATTSPSVAAAASPAATRKRKIQDDGSPITPRTVSFPPNDDDRVAAAPTSSKRACRRTRKPSLPAVEKPVAVSPPKKPSATARRGKVTAGGGAPAPSRRAEPAHEASEGALLAKSGRTVQTRIDDAFNRAAIKAPTAGPGENGLPPHLADLVDLHRAFVKSMTIQMAHSGSNIPVDVRSLAPNISLAWGKRQVTIDDIRRCVALQASAAARSPFLVTDYGRGKVCVELNADASPSVDEDGLCRQFEDGLRRVCADRARDDGDAMTDGDDVGVSLDALSLADLPRADIANRDLGLGANPILARGQRALTELHNDVVARQQDRDARKQAAPMLNRDGSRMSLLDRLRHRQLARDSARLPPSGPELERRAALSRVADVSSTISMLSLSKPASLPRQAFPMAAVLDRLRDSLRVPVSREEAAACVRVIASEVAPEWLRVVSLGGRENVVIQRNMQPVDRVLRERVDKLSV